MFSEILHVLLHFGIIRVPRALMNTLAEKIIQTGKVHKSQLQGDCVDGSMVNEVQ